MSLSIDIWIFPVIITFQPNEPCDYFKEMSHKMLSAKYNKAPYK